VEGEVSEMSNLARKSHQRLVITNTISLFSLLASIYANLGATTLNIVTLGIMTLSKMTLSITLNKATLSITLNTVMVSVNILSVI